MENVKISAAGLEVINMNITYAIVYDMCQYSSWAIYYGICHALVLLSDTDKDADYWKELREYFLDKMYQKSM